MAKSFFVWTLLAFAALPACTVVTVESDGKVVSERSFGIRSISLQQRHPALIETEGFGIVVGANHLTIGWMNEQMAVVPDPSQCQMLAIVQHLSDFYRLVEVIRESGMLTSSVCMIGRRST